MLLTNTTLFCPVCHGWPHAEMIREGRHVSCGTTLREQAKAPASLDPQPLLTLIARVRAACTTDKEREACDVASECVRAERLSVDEHRELLNTFYPFDSETMNAIIYVVSRFDDMRDTLRRYTEALADLQAIVDVDALTTESA